MQQFSKSGLNCTNRLARYTLLALEEGLGKNGLNAILNLSSLPHLKTQYPLDSLDRGFDFSDFSRIFGCLEDFYGARGVKGIAFQAGRTVFERVFFYKTDDENDASTAPINRPVFPELLDGLNDYADKLSNTSDQLTTIEEKEDQILFIIHKCPECWERTAANPACYFQFGLLAGCLNLLIGGQKTRMQQVESKAHGDNNCVFIIDKTHTLLGMPENISERKPIGKSDLSDQLPD